MEETVPVLREIRDLLFEINEKMENMLTSIESIKGFSDENTISDICSILDNIDYDIGFIN
jgi:hypothetical protein